MKYFDVSMNENPGGSLGDFITPTFNNMSELVYYLQNYAGDLYSSNVFFIENIRNKKVADMGCGYGYFTTLLSQYTDSIDGFDIDLNAINYAKESLSRLTEPAKINFFHFDGYNTQVKSETYDAVVSFEVIEHVTEPLTYLKECYRILKSGGRFYLSTPNGLIANKNDCIIKYHSRSHLTEFFPSELYTMLTGQGFLVEKIFRKINNQSDEHRYPNKNLLRRFKIFIVCRLKRTNFTYFLLKKVMKAIQRKNYIGSDNYMSYTIEESSIEAINAQNCDVILIQAIKPE